MKRMIKIAGMALAIVMGASAAQAQGIRPYVGFGVGSFGFDVNVAGLNDSGSALGYFGIFGADFTDNLGGEIRIGATDNASLFGLNYDLNNFISLLGKFQAPVAYNMDLYGLLGLTSATLTTSGGVNNTQTGLSFGAGIDYSLDGQVSARAEWVRYWNSVSLNNAVDATVDGFSAMVDYHF